MTEWILQATGQPWQWLLDALEDVCGVPVTIASCGPTYADKLLWDAKTREWVQGIPVSPPQHISATNSDELEVLRAELIRTKAELTRLKAAKGQA